MMRIEVTYEDGHIERFDVSAPANSTVSAKPLALNETQLRWEGDGRRRSLVLFTHHIEDPCTSTDGASAETDRIRGPRSVIVDASELEAVLSVEVDGDLFTWREGTEFVDGTIFRHACRKHYAGPAAASINERAVWLYQYLCRAQPELAGNDEAICAQFGYSVDAYRRVEYAEIMQLRNEEEQ